MYQYLTTESEKKYNFGKSAINIQLIRIDLLVIFFLKTFEREKLYVVTYIIHWGHDFGTADILRGFILYRYGIISVENVKKKKKKKKGEKC